MPRELRGNNYVEARKIYDNESFNPSGQSERAVSQ